MLAYSFPRTVPVAESLSGIFVFGQHPQSPHVVYTVTILSGPELPFQGGALYLARSDPQSRWLALLLTASNSSDLTNFTHKAGVNWRYGFSGTFQKYRTPGSKSRHAEKLTLARFEPVFHSQKSNVLTTLPHARILIG